MSDLVDQRVGDAVLRIRSEPSAKGVVMGQATVDLPDPSLGTSPAEAQSADDLLSQLAGNEIDRLLAENDEVPVAAAQSDATPVSTDDLDVVLADAAADRDAAERSALHESPPPTMAHKPVDAAPHIELGDDGAKLPLLFRPLEWLSAPLDPWPDQLREVMGKIGLMTLINALAVLAYVMYRRHHP